jgi:hypothetical protein
MSELVFTQPAMLWGLFAASIPIIIHLINRHRARKRPFAALDFLLRVQRRTARRILLRQILLLATRTLIIAALIIAAAGPVLKPRRPALAPGPTSTVVIIDRSFSMQTRGDDDTWFTIALDRARALVRGMSPGDRLCLLSAGTTTEVLVDPCTDSSMALLDALDELEPGFGASNLTEALEKAAPLLAAAPGPNRRMLLLTDLAAHAFPGPPSFPADLDPPEIVLENVAEHAPRDNHAVLQVEQANRGRFLEVTARFISHSSGDQPNLPAEIYLGKEMLARGFVDLKAQEAERKVFNIPAPKLSVALGKVQLSADRLAQDDARTFFVSGRRTVNALLVDGDMRPVLHQDELFYLEHALAPTREGSSGISFTTITPERFRADMLEQAEVVFLANIRELPADTAAALRGFVAAGGGLFISVGDQVDVERSNAFLEDLLPWPLRDVVALGPADPDGVQREGVAFSGIDLEHPVLSIFKGIELSSLKTVRTWRAAVVEPGQGGPQTRVLMRYANGSPALVEGAHLSGRVLLFTATLDRDWTSWPARASFLPFLQRSTSYLAGRLSQLPPLEITVGKQASIPLVPEADSLQITRPDGISASLGPGDFSGQLAIFRDTRYPGWYPIVQTKAGQKIQRGSTPGLIVHLPPAESDLQIIPAERLQSLVGEGTRITLAGAGNDATRSRSSIFLLLALALALTEAFLVRR